MIRTRIMATGACVPEQIITNDDLSKIVDTSDEWISQRTGIRERRISAGENTSALAIGTAKQVIERAEISPEDVDLIIVASVTPDYGTPSLACMVQKELGMVNAVAFDVVAACSGFMFALSIADKYIKTGVYRNAVVIGAETLSKIRQLGRQNDLCIVWRWCRWCLCGSIRRGWHYRRRTWQQRGTL